MGLIKITPADAALSKCVRERSAWTCEERRIAYRMTDWRFTWEGGE